MDVQTAYESKPVTVYNLTVDQDHVYYANGILAANCLTFAFPVAPPMPGEMRAAAGQCEVEYDPLAER